MRDATALLVGISTLAARLIEKGDTVCHVGAFFVVVCLFVCVCLCLCVFNSTPLLNLNYVYYLTLSL